MRQGACSKVSIAGGLGFEDKVLSHSIRMIRSGSDTGGHGFLSREIHLCIKCRQLRVNIWHFLKLAAKKVGASEK